MMNQTQLLQELISAIEQPKVSPENVQEELIEQRSDEYDAVYESNPVLAAIDERMTITNPDFDFQIPSMADVVNEEVPADSDLEEPEKAEKSDIITKPKPQTHKKVQKSQQRSGSRTLKIAVIGAMRRIGTTTVALQLVKYLNDQEEHAAAYLQYNNSDFITDLKEICCADVDTGKPDKITFANTDIFSDSQESERDHLKWISVYRL